MTNTTKLLDHGYLKFIERWGSDEAIIEAARMSTDGGFVSWDPYEGHPKGDAGLLAYLWRNKHSTPFEMAGLTIEVQAPILVFRQWHRHRTQCLAPDTLVHFESPKGKRYGRRYVYKMRIEDVWKKWQPTTRASRPERQTNAFFKRDRVKGMLLRCLDEEGGEIVETHIRDVIKGSPKAMVRVITASGRSITATREHRFMTSQGWMTLGDAIETKMMLTLEGTTRAKANRWGRPEIEEDAERWLPVVGWEDIYQVSDMGRVRRLGSKPKRNTVGGQGYDVVSLSRNGRSYSFTVHRLVLEAFVGPCPTGHETRHIDDNRANPSLRNLEWATPKRNGQDRVERDRQQRLVPTFEEIVSVEEVGELPTYDLSVEGPGHNFVADGFVVHNSYNEMSARYTPLPNVNYRPTVERCIVVDGANKQAGKTTKRTPTHEEVLDWLENYLDPAYTAAELAYSRGLQIGIPKEVARCPVPVARYTRMRASANLRNWLAFLTLRIDSHAQEEIRVYAEALGVYIQRELPRTWELFAEGLRP